MKTGWLKEKLKNPSTRGMLSVILGKRNVAQWGACEDLESVERAFSTLKQGKVFGYHIDTLATWSWTRAPKIWEEAYDWYCDHADNDQEESIPLDQFSIDFQTEIKEILGILFAPVKKVSIEELL